MPRLLALVLAAVCVASAAAAAPARIEKVQLTGGDVYTGSVVIADGSVWVASHGGPGVYRIDPRTNKIVKWIKVGENQCVDLAAYRGAIWVWNCSGETGRGIAYEIDAKTNKVVARLPGLYGTLGDGSLWTQSQDWKVLLRIDPRSHVVLARIKLPMPLPATGHVFPSAVCGGSVWSVADTAVVRYDTATNKVAAVVELPGAVSGSTATGGYYDSNYAACAAGKVFVGNLAALYAIDEKTNAVTRLPFPTRPSSGLGDPGLVAAGNHVFLRTSDTTVVEIDARSGKRLHVYTAGGSGGEQIAVGYGSLWVGAAALSQVWREPLQH